MICISFLFLNTGKTGNRVEVCRLTCRFCNVHGTVAGELYSMSRMVQSTPSLTCVFYICLLQDCFSDETSVKSLLQNVASILRPGGYFFGITADSSTIWYITPSSIAIA
jgi:hypothetical protein